MSKRNKRTPKELAKLLEREKIISIINFNDDSSDDDSHEAKKLYKDYKTKNVKPQDLVNSNTRTHSHTHTRTHNRTNNTHSNSHRHK